MRPDTLAEAGRCSPRRLAPFQMTRYVIRAPSREAEARRASCEIAGHRFETQGPAPVYRMITLLWLHGHGGAAFEVWDDVSPTGRPGGLAMTGRVRNWASFDTPKGMPMFRMKSKPDPDFTPEQWATAAKAAGVVVSMDADSRRTFAPGCATSPQTTPSTPRRKMGPLRALSPLTPRRRHEPASRPVTR